MKFFASEIVADARNIELELHDTEEDRRIYLIGWFNDHVSNGGLGDDVIPVPDTATEALIAEVIEMATGRTVVLSEVWT